MGRNSQTRRAAKAKARAKQRARAAHDHRSAASEAPDAADWFRHDGPPPPGRSSAEDHAREASTLWWLLSRPDASGETTALANLRRLHAIIPETTAHAAEAVLLAPLTPVDLQLLRLELMDARGRLPLAALVRLHAQRPDGEEVGASLDALLQGARAQLELQVQARIQQAGRGRGGAAAASGGLTTARRISSSPPATVAR